MLPPDGHVHTEWSWDAAAGSMERSCERALALGLPSIAFTEHADYTPWTRADGRLEPPELDVAGYLACVQRCRDRFPGLRILSGVEVGEPHWHRTRVEALTGGGGFDRVLGSLHSAEARGEFRLVDDLYGVRRAGQVVRDYLGEALRMVESGADFAVLAHIDYPIRYWPESAGPYDPRSFRSEYRSVLRALARTGRALEVNTTVPLHPEVVRWWYEEGGEAVSFGSDAHEPSRVAGGFAEAGAMVEAAGFRPGRHPHDFWVRSVGGRDLRGASLSGF
jgi:histidinol-phosphatase (PHP family)